MDLRKKRSLAARTIGVGVGRVMFNTGRLDEIKEAITKQDIRDLVASKAIFVREIKGRHAGTPRRRRRTGSIRMRPNERKHEYMTLTRKLRAYVLELRKQNKVSQEQFVTLRKEIKSKQFKNKAHFKERIALMHKGAV